MLQLLLQIRIDLPGGRQTVRSLIPLQRFCHEFAPSPVNFAGPERSLIQKDLQPRDHFPLGNRFGPRNASFERRCSGRLLDRRWRHRTGGKTQIRPRGRHRPGPRFFRLSRISNKRRHLWPRCYGNNWLLRAKACRNPKNPNDNKKLLVKHTK